MQDNADASSRGTRSAFLVGCVYACLLLLTATFWGFYLTRQKSFLDYAYRTDFVGIYVGARIVAHGHGAHLYDLNGQRAEMDQSVLPLRRSSLMAFVYPGYVAVLLHPLGNLPLSKAIVVMLLLNIAVAIWIAWIVMARFLENFWQRLIFLLAFCSFVPLQLTLLQNQLGLFPTLGLVQAVLALRSRQPIRAGCWMLAGLLKPQLIILPLLALLIWRCWSALAAFAVGTLALTGISFAWLGWWIPRYLGFLREYSRAGPALSLFPMAMQNWRGLVFVLFSAESSLYWLLLAILAFLSLIAVVYLCFRVGVPRDCSDLFTPSREFRFALVITLGILASPHLYLHDWVLFVPAAVILWQSLAKLGCDNTLKVLLILLAASPLVFWLGQFGPRIPHIQLVPWYMGIFAVIAVFLVERIRVAQESAR